jgi:penicillin-binding protein 1A
MSMRSELPSVKILKEIQWQTPMQIFSSDGKLISQFGENKRIPLTLDQFPQQLIDALLATEDDRFYYHFGVDPIGMSRAILGQLTGQNKGGASTITMQVARNFFLSSEVTYSRKIREIFLSFHIESQLTKDEIISLYLNKIPLGHRSFGFGAAAQVYFGKDVQDLSLSQIAVLAGLPKAPSSINPIRSPSKAKSRRNVVLGRMLDSGYITKEEYELAKSEIILSKKHGAEIELSAPYLAQMAHQEMLDRFGKDDAYSKGYKVFTTVPSYLQISAQNAVLHNLHAYDQRHGYRGPIFSLRPHLRDLANDSNSNPLVTEKDKLSNEELDSALNEMNTYQSLIAGIVTQVNEQSVDVQLIDGSTVTIEWEGLSWAREFINDRKQGIAPEFAHQILSYGDAIFLTRSSEIYRLSQLPQASSALISLSPDDGAIKALVGGYSFKQSQFNRVTQAKRQVGSNIKPFIYSAALDNGFTLASLVNDAPIDHWDKSGGSVWRPKNSPAIYDGPIRVRLALAQSKNVVAVRLFRQVGKKNVIEHLQSFGFEKTSLPSNDTLALGSASLTPMQIATGYAAFANGGFLVEPYFIERIEDSFGNIVFEANPKIVCSQCEADNTDSIESDIVSDVPTIIETAIDLVEAGALDEGATEESSINLKTIEYAKRVISPQNAFLVTQAMNSVIWGADWKTMPYWQGTGWRSRALNRKDLAGKTGTTNQSKDAWFSGFSRRLVTSAWIGFDDPSRDLGRTYRNANLDKKQITGTEAGANAAQPAWNLFMKDALPHFPYEEFTLPNDIVSARIDKETGKLSYNTDNTSTFEYFKLGTTPKEYVVETPSYEESTSDNSSGDESYDDIF